MKIRILSVLLLFLTCLCLAYSVEDNKSNILDKTKIAIENENYTLVQHHLNPILRYFNSFVNYRYFQDTRGTNHEFHNLYIEYNFKQGNTENILLYFTMLLDLEYSSEELSSNIDLFTSLGLKTTDIENLKKMNIKDRLKKITDLLSPQNQGLLLFNALDKLGSNPFVQFKSPSRHDLLTTAADFFYIQGRYKVFYAAQLDLGTLYMEREEYNLAYDSFHKAVLINQIQEFDITEALFLKAVASLYLDDYETAKQSLIAALPLSLNYGNSELYTLICYYLAYQYTESGDMISAYPYYFKALEMAIKIDNSWMIRMIAEDDNFVIPDYELYRLLDSYLESYLELSNSQAINPDLKTIILHLNSNDLFELDESEFPFISKALEKYADFSKIFDYFDFDPELLDQLLEQFTELEQLIDDKNYTVFQSAFNSVWDFMIQNSLLPLVLDDYELPLFDILEDLFYDSQYTFAQDISQKILNYYNQSSVFTRLSIDEDFISQVEQYLSQSGFIRSDFPGMEKYYINKYKDIFSLYDDNHTGLVKHFSEYYSDELSLDNAMLSYFGLSLILFNKGQSDDALHWLKKLELILDNEMKILSSAVWNLNPELEQIYNLGVIINLALHNYPAAFEYAIKQLQLYQPNIMIETKIEDYLNMALLFYLSGDSESALETYSSLTFMQTENISDLKEYFNSYLYSKGENDIYYSAFCTTVLNYAHTLAVNKQYNKAENLLLTLLNKLKSDDNYYKDSYFIDFFIIITQTQKCQLFLDTARISLAEKTLESAISVNEKNITEINDLFKSQSRVNRFSILSNVLEIYKNSAFGKESDLPDLIDSNFAAGTRLAFMIDLYNQLEK
jgi:hypothetical protein